MKSHKCHSTAEDVTTINIKTKCNTNSNEAQNGRMI